MANPQFSLIIACYNEEENLEKTVRLSKKTLNRLFAHYEIILVDDKSEDRSPKIADRLARKDRKVKVIHNPINLGQGISFLIGLEVSKGELIMQNGADRPFDITDLKKLLRHFPEYDVVVAVRKNRRAYSFWRKLTSWGNILLRGIFFGFRYKDLNFVQVYKRRLIDNLSIQSRSAAFVTQELVLKADEKGYKIRQVRLPYYRRKGGKANHGKKRDILWAFIDMLNFWLEQKK